jgi:hypothetical protein
VAVTPRVTAKAIEATRSFWVSAVASAQTKTAATKMAVAMDRRAT